MAILITIKTKIAIKTYISTHKITLPIIIICMIAVTIESIVLLQFSITLQQLLKALLYLEYDSDLSKKDKSNPIPLFKNSLIIFRYIFSLETLL